MTYTNKYASKFSSPILQRLFQCPVAGIVTHWFFQGMLYMDRTERRFKLLFDGAFTVLFAILLREWPWPMSWLLAFLAAHTLNFLFNGQLWVVLKHYGLVHHSADAFEKQAQQLAQRIAAEPSLHYAAVYGSTVRGEWKASSDLDVRLIRSPGWHNGLRACRFALRERSRAMFSRFPLDLYLLDSMEQLRMRDDEAPLVLVEYRVDRV